MKEMDISHEDKLSNYTYNHNFKIISDGKFAGKGMFHVALIMLILVV